MLPYIFISVLSILVLITFLFFYKKYKKLFYDMEDVKTMAEVAQVPIEERKEIIDTLKRMRNIYEKHEKKQLSQEENQPKLKLLETAENGYVEILWDRESKQYVMQLTERGEEYIRNIESSKDLGIMLQTMSSMKHFKRYRYSMNGEDLVYWKDAEMFKYLIQEMATKLVILSINEELSMKKLNKEKKEYDGNDLA